MHREAHWRLPIAESQSAVHSTDFTQDYKSGALVLCEKELRLDLGRSLQ